MKSYPVIKVDLALNADAIKGKSAADVKKFIDESVAPVLLAHLTKTTRDGSVDIHCTADSHGNASCTGGVSIHF